MIEMNTSAATTPTKIAAIHSIESMKRSMVRAFTFYALQRDSGGEISPPPHSLSIGERSIRRLVFRERRRQVLHDRVRIAAGLLDVVGPGLAQRLGRFFPLVKLRIGDRIDLVPRLGLQFRN